MFTSAQIVRSIACISIGAALGASTRWGLTLLFNVFLPQTVISLGTLSANLLGGFLIGVAISFAALLPEFSPEWRLFIITGFLGALTTFSTFSAEAVSLLSEQRIGAAMLLIGLHVVGSLFMTFTGIALVNYMRS